jgi:hypothetical protein
LRYWPLIAKYLAIDCEIFRGNNLDCPKKGKIPQKIADFPSLFTGTLIALIELNEIKFSRMRENYYGL